MHQEGRNAAARVARGGAAPAPVRGLCRRRVIGLGAGVLVAAGSGALGSLLAACSGGEETGRSKPAEPKPAPGAETGATAPAAQAAGGADADDTKLVTAYPQNAALVKSLGYVHESQKPDQHCSNCFFFTPTSEGRGRCQLFPRGRVEVGGWCTSWQAKPA